MMDDRYKCSEALLERALRTIPLGSQTFSKSLTQYPRGVSPFFIQRAKGSHAWDVDGNEYVDFVSALCSVTLGYSDPDVDAAVRAQLTEGVIFSLPHPIEARVAEAIVEMVPCAEKVRFGKNGSDATAGAIRLARAHTRRDRVAVCGYHGWQDWYIGTTARFAGVPEATRGLTHSFAYNNVDGLAQLLDQYPGEFAAVILEPMNVAEPAPGFLEELRELTKSRGILLIFDETITGFRYANGGAQEKFGVTPDLATFGKGLANGYPLSAIAGREKYMRQMEDIFFSFTFGGEALSLAAAEATLTKLRREPVLDTIRARGTNLMSRLNGLLERHGATGLFAVAGDPTWSFLLTTAPDPAAIYLIKTYIMQEFHARGLLSVGTHTLNYAHSDTDIDLLIRAYEEIVPFVLKGINEGTLAQELRCAPLEPLFKVR